MKKSQVFSLIVMACVMAVSLVSCKKEDPAPVPTVRFLVDISSADSYTVDITLESTDAKSFVWDYGDGNTSTKGASHSYTYTASGDYTITVNVTGDGGTATASEDMSIAASLEEILAGSGDDGKAWVLTQSEADFSGKIGAGPVAGDNALIPEMSLIPTGVMDLFGLGAEYPDEFIFFKDGSYQVNALNSQALAGIVYGGLTETLAVMSTSPENLPLCAVYYNNVTEGTWALSYDDLTVTAFNEFTTGAVEDVVYTFGEDASVANLVLSSGAYIGLVDLAYPAIPELGIADPFDNSYYVIKEVSPEAIHVVIGINGVPFLDADGKPTYDVAPDITPIFMYPTFTLHLTFVPK